MQTSPPDGLVPAGPAIPRLVEGWAAVAEHIQKRTGIHVSIDAAKRWARRAQDPLPTRRWGTGRPRVVADAQVLDSWCDRQWVHR